MNQRDYYRILGLEPSASPKHMKEAYRELAFKYHPDRNKGNPQASEKMKALNEAYAVLSDPAKRRQYDALRQQFGSSAYSQFRKNYSEQDIFRGSDIHRILEEMAKAFGFRGYEDIFREFYGQGYRSFQFKRPGFFATGFVFFGHLRWRERDQRQLPLQGYLGKLSRFFLEKISGVQLPESGSDIHDILQLTPEQAQEGGPYAYFLGQKSKKFVVKIPPRVREGQLIRLAGMGEDGKGGAKPGDLYLKVQIKKPLLQKMKRFISHLTSSNISLI
jgi:DnaJ-class molecular chaperone